ncbi:MAG: nitronate monooxygenase [Chloroflexi bacterium]|nr:nitronate monooxygenase [Chloroflexota bacterium]
MFRTRITELLGIEHPIISAPMAGIATANLVAAVSAAGGFGLIGGTTPGGADWLREQIRAVRERTDRPFGVGFISSFPGLDELVAVALEEKVAAISHSFADPTTYIPAAHAAGVKVLVQVQTVAQAVVAVNAGADAIAAQGTEAGGHTGYSGTMAIVPTVVDVAKGVPVIAAGGIADGRGLAAALMLGAEGAWIGTRFVASVEAVRPQWQKDRIVEASADDTVVTRAYDLAANAAFPDYIIDRVLRNDFTDVWAGRDADVAARRDELGPEVARATQENNQAIAPVRAGNASGMVHAVEPAGDILRRIVREAELILRERVKAVLRSED